MQGGARPDRLLKTFSKIKNIKTMKITRGDAPGGGRKTPKREQRTQRAFGIIISDSTSCSGAAAGWLVWLFGVCRSDLRSARVVSV